MEDFGIISAMDDLVAREVRLWIEINDILCQGAKL